VTGDSGSDGQIRRWVLAGLGLIVLEGGSSGSAVDRNPDDSTVERKLDAPARHAGANERVAFDLIRFWFDQVWAPGVRYMDGFKGDRDPALEEAFRDAFSEEEYLWLERFNRFLELRVDRLSDRERTEERFPAGDTWLAIVRDARNLIELLDPSGQERLEDRKLLDTFEDYTDRSV